MNIEDSRKAIDKIDDQIIELFRERMECSLEVAKYKKENNLPVLSTKREREIINRLSEKLGGDMSIYVKMLYGTMFEISKAYQSKNITKETNTALEIKSALENTSKLMPENITVACQGVEGAYSEIAAEKMIKNPTITFFNNFKGVFEAVNEGLCRFGILPYENSIHGSVSEVTDLLCEYNLKIVKASRLQINHILFGKKGTKNIREIVSHEQALGQCSEFIKTLGNVKITVCENTAEAAKMVAESDRDDIASISSMLCGELYGLTKLNSDINNSDNNYTRFICVSKNAEIYPGANKMTVRVELSNSPGSLYNLISKFSSAGVNLTKIESRPICGRDFEFVFLLDMEVSSYSEEFLALINMLSSEYESFKFLGAYAE